MLNKKIEQTKTNFYDEKNIEEYLEKSSIKLQLPTELMKYSKEHDIDIHEINYGVFPSNEWYFTFPKVVKDDFKVEYSTVLTISKLTTVYSLLNCFEVENEDIEQMVPILSGNSEEAYSKLQYDFFILANDLFQNLSYDRLLFTKGIEK
ncbi:hypothetical protein [Carnobacterium maltaromaticum]